MLQLISTDRSIADSNVNQDESAGAKRVPQMRPQLEVAFIALLPKLL